MLEVPLSSDGQSTRVVPLGDVLVALTTRYNYYARVWVLDVQDAQGGDLLLGLALVPGLDLLAPYPQLKKRLGGLLLLQRRREAHRDPEGLGTDAQLLWFAPGEPVEVPA